MQHQDSAYVHPVCEYHLQVFFCFLFLTSFTRDVQKEDPSYDVAEYSSSTTTGTLQGHLLKFHLRIYIAALEQYGLKVGAKEVRDILDIGWTLAHIGQELDQNPDKLLESFGSPGGGSLGSQPRSGVSAPGNDIPDLTIEEMHRQLVKFIVVDDQVSTYLLSTMLLLIDVFRR